MDASILWQPGKPLHGSSKTDLPKLLSWFFNVFMGGYGFKIFSKGKLMIADRLQYLFDDFWSFVFSPKSGPVDPVFIPQILRKIQNAYGNIIDNILFPYLRI